MKVFKVMPPWTLAVTALFSVHMSAALSVGLIQTVGPAGAAWLRLTMGALIILALTRPWLHPAPRSELPILMLLGLATGFMSVTFLAAIERIPLGVVVAVGFLGPLSLIAFRSHSLKAMAWPLVALIGVVLLTEPWHSAVDFLGLGFAGLTALCWAAYIVLTQRIGDSLPGVTALAFTIPVAAVATATLGIPQAIGHLTTSVVAAAVGLAVLMPVLPFALEMHAIRQMTPRAFGTLMALDPAVGLLIGLIVLEQHASGTQLAGLSLVIAAAAAAQRGDDPPHPAEIHPRPS